MDEIAQLNRLRSEVPQPDLSELHAEELRLLADIAAPSVPRSARQMERRRPGVRLGKRMGIRVGIAGGLVAAGITGIVVTDLGSGGPKVNPPIRTAAVASVVLLRAADATGRQQELHPRPGQYLVFESQNMDSAEVNNEKGHFRYLSRSKRKVWLPVSGSAVRGFISSESLAPEPYPGSPLPPEAKQGQGKSGPEKLADFDGRAEFLRTDYAYLSRLPTDTEGMREHLYAQLPRNSAAADWEAWGRVIDDLREAYLPAAQRAALYRVTATIPGVETISESQDAAGRKGIAAAMVNTSTGIREEYIFDRKTYQYLGERAVVVDADKAKAPVGSLVASSAQLKVSVVDSPPEIPAG